MKHRGPYPHSAVAEVRQAKVDDAKQALLAAEAGLREALASVARAEAEVATHDAETERVRADERARMARGEPMDGRELSLAASYFAARVKQRVALVESVAARKREASAAAEVVNAARDGVGAARAEAEVVARHRARFDEAVKADAEADAEKEAEDVTLGRRRPT